jgi:hypothetical protein
MSSETVNDQMLTSFLSFWADNRFKALEAIKGMLPDNPKWLTEDGSLYPFTILALHQCKPHEASMYAQEYTERFRVAAGIASSAVVSEKIVYH